MPEPTKTPTNATTDRGVNRAERVRFTHLKIDYIGLQNPEKEVEIVTDQTPVTVDVARCLVDAANRIRLLDRDDDLEAALSANDLIQWAETSAEYADNEIENPVMKAATNTVIEPITTTDTDRDTLEQIVRDHTAEIAQDEVCC